MKYTPSKAITELGPEFYDEVAAADFPEHILRFKNEDWAFRVGLGRMPDEKWISLFGKFEPLEGSLEKPLALRYHGHQFRSYNPDLGDGRGFLFAQLRDEKRLLDLGTKGSGTTPYSRRGDGRLTLKGAVREVLATEMLESLGVYTSKTFAVVETGESLERHDEPSPTRAAALTRLSHGHIRFGTFQRLAFFQEQENIAKLVDYCIKHFYPELAEEKNRAAAFLREVSKRAADLAASWMMAGFVHGVLNTDNMNITGESFDYGPYRFLPKYDPSFTAAYFDNSGLYAYGRQPETVLWNLEQLGACLVFVSDREPLIEALQEFAPTFNSKIASKFIERMGLESQDETSDGELFIAAFDFLAASQVGFEQFFHDWYGGEASANRYLNSAEREVYMGEQFEVFKTKLRSYKATTQAQERLKDAYFLRAKPCSLLIDEIEAIWDEIAKKDDWSRFEQKVADIRMMGKLYGRRNN